LLFSILPSWRRTILGACSRRGAPSIRPGHFAGEVLFLGASARVFQAPRFTSSRCGPWPSAELVERIAQLAAVDRQAAAADAVVEGVAQLLQLRQALVQIRAP